ncbi:Fic family protein [Luteolibacter sp. Populi]|uniref:Fic family protein n=1 Tax=Luteolibacter sp. Populi TaxID=3230487 RepID=UPI0034651F61
MPKEIHTRLRPEGGIEEYEVEATNSTAKSLILDPESETPQKTRRRYTLPIWILGKLEVLAQSRVEIFSASNKTKEELNTWSLDDPGTVWNIVHTVHASSRIENEGVQASQVPAIYHAVTRARGQTSEELDLRQSAERDISLAYFWALSNPRRPLLSVDFVLELHRRMFESSRPEIAGCFKTSEVFIADDERQFYNVSTLPYPKAKRYLAAACERTCKAFDDADKLASHSKLIIIAEFILDFLAIHPFQDGNGRTARLLSTYLLEACGYHFARFYPIDQVILDGRNDYFAALFSGQTNWYNENEDLTQWITYYIEAVFKQWERAFSEIRDLASKQEDSPANESKI